MVLKLGSQNLYVGKAQKLMNLDGAGLTVDNNFGKATKSAVLNFQKKHGLKQDGTIGPQTWIKLEEMEDRPYRITKHDNQIVYVSFGKDVEMDVLDSRGIFEPVPKMFKRLDKKPSFIINGGLFCTKTGASLSKFIDNGKKITNGYYSKFGIKVNKDGKICFGYEDKETFDMLGASPTLIIDGKINIDSTGLSNSFLNTRHPRSAIAESANEFHFIIAHGRRSWLSHRGMKCIELAQFCLNTLKATNAINLDGGGSCYLIDDNGNAINMPLETRGIDNAVCVYL